MIRKLVNLIKNYDKIMLVIENYESTAVTKTKSTEKSTKRCSTLNTPKEQLAYIADKMKGEK